MGGLEVAAGVELRAPVEGRDAEILSADALAFVAELHRRFDGTRRELLAARAERQARIDAGELPDFLPETREIREGEWRVAPVPPTCRTAGSRSPAPSTARWSSTRSTRARRCFMADFEDANSPTWRELLDGQANLIDAIERHDRARHAGEKSYRLNDEPAVLLVRPRGWHLAERHVLVDGEPISGEPLRLRALPLPQRAGACSSTGSGPVLLPAQAGEPPRGPALERRLRLRPGGARARPRARSRRPS